MSIDDKLIIYEGAACCSGSLCGPGCGSAADIQNLLDNLKVNGVSVERYNITQNSRKFMENARIASIIAQQQLKALPITVLNGDVIKVGSYPTFEEIRYLVQNPGKELNGCCSDKNSCDIKCRPDNNNACCGDSSGSCC